ncbi:MAG: DUF2115 family protein [Methanobacteriaceae archaeon]|nr:DUF2115 family protein [Methanobacteriaceae archaeon]
MEMFKDLIKLSQQSEISKNNVLDILKDYAKTIGMYDQMIACTKMKEENVYIQKEYAEKFESLYIKSFIFRVNDIESDKNEYVGLIDKFMFNEAIGLFKFQYGEDSGSRDENDKFPLIYALISFYTTFILGEPIHPVGSPFPGNLYVIEEDGKYLCPVKDAQEDSPNAVCKMCVAENLDHKKC